MDFLYNTFSEKLPVGYKRRKSSKHDSGDLESEQQLMSRNKKLQKQHHGSNKWNNEKSLWNKAAKKNKKTSRVSN